MSDCQYNLVCSSLYTCEHKDIFPPSIIDIIAYVLLPILVGIGNVGGLGGGIIKVPLLMILMNYQQRKATFISYCIVLGGCLANSLLILRKQHPLKKKPLIDYNIIMIINPMVILGTNIGIILNVIFPEIVSGVLFIIFLCTVSPYLFKKESQLSRDNDLEKVNNSYIISDVKVDNIAQSQIKNNDPGELKCFLMQEERQYPLNKLLILMFVFVSIQFLIFLRGGKGVGSFIGIKICSNSYWLLSAGILVYSLVVSYFIKIFISRNEIQKKMIFQKYGLEEYFKDDFDISDNKKYFIIWASGLLSGCLSGTFGSGAALLLMPVFISYQLPPIIGSAVCGFNYFFIACASIISVFSEQYLTAYEVIIYSFLAFLGGFVCARILYGIVERKKAQHIVVFIVVSLAVLNIIGNIVYLIKKKNDYGIDSLLSFGNFCEH
ncbi:hypothetical protein IMG5_031030 [Ichthyophthirius multifiliis]|uniref:Sulfite exporter TauE/SafE n=1 Tax=Ichthyophthirius multifiliis TaxID=5932 RepID=G0QLI5_ICHMU|nr:hypothetical protein IMG5_031030 [Ichthyophthirius multifiliis]EGR33919.1 hypothetical protein IMG5_031030 [Ichthyophthirius multifiliis]|eukprot:XP_004039223.1 hypothetical protein IMG5_031030 [Ichthyophthirius multifiliis]